MLWILLLTFVGVYNLYTFHTQITVNIFITPECARCENLTMLVLGDWGDTLLPGQQQVADRMAEWAEVNSPQFIISTGDNFYPNGVRSVDDRFKPQHFKTLPLKRFTIFSGSLTRNGGTSTTTVRSQIWIGTW